MRYRYVTLDVFTATPFAGNPLAVVFGADKIASDAMQAVAREFNLSETVFVLPPVDPRHKARLRIFTPGRELPFAGHPTIGTAVCLALNEASQTDASAFGLEEGIGVVPCVVERKTGTEGYARFRLPRLPELAGDGPEPAEAAWALGLDPKHIGFDRHLPSRHSAGTAFAFVPVASLDVISKLTPSADAMGRVFGAEVGVFAYTRETSEAGHQFHARMFGSPATKVYEDPATGSAVAAFAGALMQFEPLGDGEHAFVIEQGYEMGRPSRIDLQIVIAGGALRAAEIGGSAILITEGHITIAETSA